MGEDIAVVWRWEVTCSEQKAVGWYQHYELSVHTKPVGFFPWSRNLRPGEGKENDLMLTLGHVSIRGMGVCIYHLHVCPHSSLSLDVIILPPRIYRSKPSFVCQRVKGKDLVSRKPVSFISLADQFLNHIFAGEGCCLCGCPACFAKGVIPALVFLVQTFWKP